MTNHSIFSSVVLLLFFVSFNSFGQNIFRVTTPHYNDSLSYAFLDNIIEKYTSDKDSVVIFLETGAMKYQDTIYTEIGLCSSTIQSINNLNKNNRKIVTSGLGSFIDLIIKKNSNQLDYVDSICETLTGQNLMMCYANQCYLENSNLRDTILKYSRLSNLDKSLLEARLSTKKPINLETKELEIIKQLTAENIKVFYLSTSFSEDIIGVTNIVLAPYYVLSDDGKIKRNKFSFLDELNNDQFQDITNKELPRKIYLNTWYKRPSNDLNGTEIYYTVLSHPCYAFEEPLPLPNRVKRKLNINSD